jgi:hypothetical protein
MRVAAVNAAHAIHQYTHTYIVTLSCGLCYDCSATALVVLMLYKTLLTLELGKSLAKYAQFALQGMPIVNLSLNCDMLVCISAHSS